MVPANNVYGSWPNVADTRVRPIRRPVEVDVRASVGGHESPAHKVAAQITDFRGTIIDGEESGEKIDREEKLVDDGLGILRIHLAAGPPWPGLQVPLQRHRMKNET
jgi:hypothetical protein